MNGAAYPKPGLHSKFFDKDCNPLVEIVQDTVGRHDTFNLACTSRYYEDMPAISAIPTARTISTTF